MTLCCLQLVPFQAAAGKIHYGLYESTKLSSAFQTKNLKKTGDDFKTRATSLSFGIFEAAAASSASACVRNGECSFGPLPRSRARPQLCRISQQEVAELAPSVSAVYGILLLGGGLFAYTKSGSKGSLFGGLTGAALLASAYFLMQSPETRAVGDALGFGSAFLFTSVFGIRLAATQKPIPAAPLLGLSVCALAVFISAYLHDSP